VPPGKAKAIMTIYEEKGRFTGLLFKLRRAEECSNQLTQQTMGGKVVKKKKENVMITTSH